MPDTMDPDDGTEAVRDDALEIPDSGADMTGLQGLRILLAEDSPDNVSLIQAYLKPSGCVVDVAENGEVAFQKFQERPYSIVLMDVQMPVADGYAATHAIRSWETERGARPTPILSLTARALPEEVQRSLLAGCTGHLTKPIRRSTLVQALQRHGAGSVPVPEQVALEGLVPRYLGNRRRDVQSIGNSLEKGAFDDLRVLGHNMRGSGTGYGFGRITQLGKALEQAAILRDSAHIGAIAVELTAYLDAIESGDARRSEEEQ